MNCIAIIPARYESTRLPGKPLQDICGKSMIQRVIEQTYKSERIESVVVATDDNRILKHVNNLGYKAVMTSAEITSGTLRCFSALDELNIDFDVMVNIQGDEPFLNPESIDALCDAMLERDWNIGTLYTEFDKPDQVRDENNVKLVTSEQGTALYFSRSIIPKCEVERNLRVFKRHVGMYSFNKRVINKLKNLSPSLLEKLERLEQLTWLNHGYSVGCKYVKERGMSVDTKSDLEEAILFAKKMGN